jgi:flagellar hook-associated protein 2
MPLVNFGNISTYGNKTTLSGMSSGLNTSEIIDVSVKAKEIPINKLKDSIEINNKKLGEFKKFRSLLSAFKTASEALRKPNSWDVSGSGAFKARTTNLTSNTSIAANNYISINTTGEATIANYSISDVTLAVAKSQSCAGFASNSTSVTTVVDIAGSFKAGTFQINGEDVTIASGASLLDIQAAINAVSENTSVEASIIQISSSNYQIVLQSMETGTAGAYTVSDPSGVLNNLTFTNKAASDASFKLNSTTITRSSNNISDVVPNLTINLLQTSPSGTSLNVAIKPDIDAVKNSISVLVGTYNDLMTYVAQQNQRDESTQSYVEGAILGGDTAVSSVMFGMGSELRRVVSGISSGYSMLPEIGISFTTFPGDSTLPRVANILEIDSSALEVALNTNFDEVRKVFDVDFVCPSTKFALDDRTNALAINDLAIDVNTSRTAGDEVRVTYADPVTAVNKTINAKYTAYGSSGGLIEGVRGTVIEGLNIMYAGSGVDSSTIHISQGISDRIFNLIDSVLADEGALKMAEDAVISANTDKQDQITRLKAQVETYRESLLKQYAEVENAVQKINSILQMLDAQETARRSANQ